MKKEQATEQATPSRRGFFMGAAAAGAAAAAVTAMPGLNTPSAELNKLPRKARYDQLDDGYS